jgi:hypothetical protein
MKAKPVVEYDNFTFEFCGETHQVKKKLTLFGVLKGEEAKALNRSRHDFTIYYYGTKGKERLEFYKEETVEDKIIHREKPSARKRKN